MLKSGVVVSELPFERFSGIVATKTYLGMKCMIGRGTWITFGSDSRKKPVSSFQAAPSK